FLQASDRRRDRNVTGVQTCALPIFALPVVAHGGLLAHGQGVVHGDGDFAVLGGSGGEEELHGVDGLAEIPAAALGHLGDNVVWNVGGEAGLIRFVGNGAADGLFRAGWAHGLKFED